MCQCWVGGRGVLCFWVWSSCSSFPFFFFFFPLSVHFLEYTNCRISFWKQKNTHIWAKTLLFQGRGGLTKKTPKHFTGEIGRTNSSVNLETSPNLSPPQILPAHPLPAKNASPPSWFLSASCWDQIGGGSEGGQPHLFPLLPPKPRRSAFLERRPLFCRFCSYHHPTLPLFQNFPSGKRKFDYSCVSSGWEI